MNIEVHRVGDNTAGGTAVVAPSGDLDMAVADQLRDCLSEIIGTGPRHLIIDLTRVTFVDSTILGVFVGARNRLGEGRVRLVATDPAVLRIFHVTGLDQVFTFHRTRDQAL